MAFSSFHAAMNGENFMLERTILQKPDGNSASVGGMGINGPRSLAFGPEG